MARPHYRAVFVSPHLDDAVFSCGGEIARLVQQGPVLVLNLFTKYLTEVKVRAVVLGAERYEEERAAAGFLGFESHSVGELDVSFRRKAYRSLGNIFKPPVPEDLGDYLAELRGRVLAYLDGIEFEQIYVPLGIGWHVDHVLTYLLFEPWIGRTPLLHYEDAPYCLIPNATRYRLDELGVYPRAASDRSLAPTGQWRAWRGTTRAYAETALMKNLKPLILRRVAGPIVGIYLYRLMALHRRLAKSGPCERKLAPVVAALGHEELSKKLAAMALYRSQFREFFTDPGDCERLCRSYASRIGSSADPIERYWKIGGFQEENRAVRDRRESLQSFHADESPAPTNGS